MKKITLLFLLCCNLHAWAGNDSLTPQPKWSIGMIGYGSFRMPVSGDLSGSRSYFLPGIQVTRVSASGKYNYRVGVEHIQRSFASPEVPTGADEIAYNGQESRSLLRIGMEREWHLHRLFSPYVSLDIAAKMGRSDFTYSGGLMGMHQREQTRTKGIGVMPSLGFKTSITPRVAFYAEFRTEAFMNNVHRKITDYNGNVDTRPQREFSFELHSGETVMAGIQVRF